MRKLILLTLFILAAMPVHAEIIGYVTSEVFLNEVKFGPEGGFLGPMYLISDGDSAGSMGMVVLTQSSGPSAGTTELYENDTLVGAFEVLVDTNLSVRNSYIFVSSIHSGDPSIIQTQNMNGTYNGQDITVSISMNLENISRFENKQFDLIYKGQPVGFTQIQHLLREILQPQTGTITNNIQIVNEYNIPISSGQVNIKTIGPTETFMQDVDFTDGQLTSTITSQENATLMITYAGTQFDQGMITLGQTYDITLTAPTNPGSFPDADNDGVPDNIDACPNTATLSVTALGCSCTQISCPQNEICQVANSIPSCYAHCADGVLNGNEERVDCGGSCGICPPQECAQPNTCLSQPQFCSQNNTVEINCQECGCPEGLTCQADGSCSTTISMEGLTCKTNNYHFSMRPLDCKNTYGPTWHQENIAASVKVDLKKKKVNLLGAILGAGLGGAIGGQLKNIASVAQPGSPNPFRFSPIGAAIGGAIGFIMSKKVKTDLVNTVKQATICVDTNDLGCVPTGMACVEASLRSGKLPGVTSILNKELESRFAFTNDLAGFGGFQAELTIDQNALIAETRYQCPDKVITQEELCHPAVVNGPSSKKADLLFIGDGETDSLAFRRKVIRLLDYGGFYANTSNEGAFSISPLKENKHRFNIWTVTANNISKVDNPLSPSAGDIPKLSDITQFAAACPQADYTFVLSEDPFRSVCTKGSGTVPCLVSLDDPYPGRLLMQEIGIAVGGLIEEFTTDTQNKLHPDVVELLIPILAEGPNCKATLPEAQAAWGDLVVDGGPIGFFQGCGGVCGEACNSMYKPTVNSVMGTNNGPPFAPWHAVNERQLLTKIGMYTPDQEGNIVDPYAPVNATGGDLPGVTVFTYLQNETLEATRADCEDIKQGTFDSCISACAEPEVFCTKPCLKTCTYIPQ